MECPRCGNDTWKIEDLTIETNYTTNVELICANCGFRKWLFAYVNDDEQRKEISDKVEE
jgi:C4-type Zn-finger protein